MREQILFFFLRRASAGANKLRLWGVLPRIMGLLRVTALDSDDAAAQHRSIPLECRDKLRHSGKGSTTIRSFRIQCPGSGWRVLTRISGLFRVTAMMVKRGLRAMRRFPQHFP